MPSSFGTSLHNIYDTVEVYTLALILLSPEQRAEVLKEVLSAFSRLPAEERHEHLVKVLHRLAEDPDRYDQDTMMAVVDLLATDPLPEATLAMLNGLPAVLRAVITGKGLKAEFREYYYDALLTRRRPEDKEAWREGMARLEGQVLAAILLDPKAGKLAKMVRPLERLKKMPRASRGGAPGLLFSVGLGSGQIGLALTGLKMMIFG